jgi:hypothetical protein
MKSYLMIAAGFVFLPAMTASAQTPADYPWHNQVQPSVSVAVDLDPTTADFRYHYTIANGAAAQQRISTLYLEIPLAVSGMATPADWEGLFGDGTQVVAFGATGDVDPAWVPAHEGDMPSFTSEIAPGSSRSGFVLMSPCGPGGGVTFYARGYNHVYAAPEDASEDTPPPSVPEWRNDAVRGTASGPGDCNIVADWGNRRPGVDGIVGLVNFASGAVLPAGPVPVQLRFARGGESVHTITLRVVLNGTDVTSQFRTNSRGDRVAVFNVGAGVQTGRNVMLVYADGVVAGGTRAVTDADRFTFTVQ